MQAIKVLIDDLAMVSHPLSGGEVVVHTLNGLTSDYKELSVALRARETVPSFDDLHDKHLDHETFLKHEDAKQGISPITAHAHQRVNTKKGKGPSADSSPNPHQLVQSSSSTGSFNFNGYRGPSPGSLPYPNFQSSNNNIGSFEQQHTSRSQSGRGSPRVVCQLCDKPCHTAKVCRSRSLPQFHTSS